jgi:mannose-1-phosphate guanylyltransferase/mannose-6-phosphate isomerase
MLRACENAWLRSRRDLDYVRLDLASFEECPSDSVDYAVMEKTTNAVVVRLDAGWSDIGAWPAIWHLSPLDEHRNAARGDVLLMDAQDSYVHATHRLVALLGTSNLVVVETPDAVLVADKDRAQDVKKIVDRLKAQKLPQVDVHREVLRPWGAYDLVDSGARFQVKRITVKPGGKLSLQMHHHRAEHWVVVSGTASVRIGEEMRLVTENESAYIPVGVKHSLENPGKVDLHLIEVQSGAYLGEDDIVRFEDLYGRE